MNHYLKYLVTLTICLNFAATLLIPNDAYSEKGISGQVVFDTAEAALKALVDAAKAEDSARMVELFGKPSEKIFITGDKASDALALRRLSQRFDQRAELFSVISEEFAKEQWYMIRFGKEGWNMHVPLVNRGKGWSYATEYASDADLRRRKAFNELAVVDTLRALTKAQDNYYNMDVNDDGIKEYAQKFISTSGQQDGLYWPNTPENSESPLDAIISRAVQDGYKLTDKTTPYGGYIYKIITAQGGKTRGGKKSYLKDGKLTEGFAILAYPVEWNSSGDATFLVAKDGQVWKRNLGSRTESIASEIESMDIDTNWMRADPFLGGKNSRSNWK